MFYNQHYVESSSSAECGRRFFFQKIRTCIAHNASNNRTTVAEMKELHDRISDYTRKITDMEEEAEAPSTKISNLENDKTRLTE